jgi:hypothetical protein
MNETVIGNRARFSLIPEPATLVMDDMRLSDAGPYRCRVDFQRSPTKNHRISLQIIGKLINISSNARIL